MPRHRPVEPNPGRSASDRTRMAWARTALAFAALGVAMLKTSVLAGLIVMAMSAPIWALGHLADAGEVAERSSRRLRLVAGTVILVAAVGLAVALYSGGR
jgi:uncharacterized membrane protein YidH (DUF202 family)